MKTRHPSTPKGSQKETNGVVSRKPTKGSLEGRLPKVASSHIPPKKKRKKKWDPVMRHSAQLPEPADHIQPPINRLPTSKKEEK